MEYVDEEGLSETLFLLKSELEEKADSPQQESDFLKCTKIRRVVIG